MREEILRMNQVTYVSQGVVRLDNFSLTVWAGEILGLVPINNDGLEALFSLLKQNLPLRSGYVYYHGKRVNGGECVVVQDMDDCAQRDFLALLERGEPEKGRLLVGGAPLTSGRDRSIAVVQERPTETMLFPSMSYMDNLCFNMDHSFPNIWASRGMRRSIREEYSPLLGAEVFDMRVDDLTDRQKYDLVFTRLLLQRPKVVFCIHPFKKAGVAIRSHIWASIWPTPWPWPTGSSG